MNFTKLFLATVLLVVTFTSCVSTNTTPTIEGLWISTEATTSQFGPGVQKVALLIKRDSTKTLTARALFLWNDVLKMEWKFINVQYDSIAKRITVLDSDLDTLKCTLDVRNEILVGILQDNTEEPLNFVRADENIIGLFHPRIPDANGQIIYRYNQPEQIDDYLLTDSIFKYAQDSLAVYNLLERILKQEFGRLESLLIIKDGNLVLEEYFYGYNQTKLHRINSCTKSVTSLLLGIALHRNNKTNIDQSVFNFFSQYDSLKTPEKEHITLHHILTMTAGFSEEEGDEEPDPDNFIQNILASPMATKPGEKFRYSGKCSNLLGGLIYTLENRQADEFAQDVLFNKLGITEFAWEKENGVIICDHGLELYPRDMAKIGLLVLNDGVWNGEQIVPKEWIVASTKPYIAESPFFDYGYQWWYRSKRNQCWWHDPVHGGKSEHDMFLALGAGGQYIMVIRDLNMVIVTTASDYNDDGIDHIKVPMVIEEIAPMFEKD
ncbi:MAG TPA: serine hydrolase [bacterium]|nr:serine hydrolase [bacterium]HPN45688.1 serine hydrolase [bacterium]